MVTTTGVKDAARRMLDKLPDDITWEDLQYHIYVRQKIEAGLKAADEGRLVSMEEIIKEFGVELP